MTYPKSRNVYGEPGNGWTLDISTARSGGTESNRARAARAGWGLGPLLAAAPKAEPAPVVFDDTPRPSAGTINFQWNGPDDVERVAGRGAPQPTPAPGQVWLPPEGAVNGYTFEPTPMLADADGTLTVGCVDPLTPPSVVWNGSGSDGQTRETNVEDITDPANGWTCIGVATPHGRVMVGDGFSDAPRFARTHPNNEVLTFEIIGIAGGSRILRRFDDGSEGEIPAASMLGHEYARTCYAPARAGERLRDLADGQVFTVTKAGPTAILDAADGSRRMFGGMAHIAGWAADPAQWERLDPGAADGVDARASLALDGARRPGESLDDYKVRMVLRIKAEQDRLLAAASPLTATGADLDDLARRIFGLDRRGSTDRETDESLRARCVELLGEPATGAALDAIASGMGIERREAVKPSGYDHVANALTARNLAITSDPRDTIIVGKPANHDLLTFQACAAHLRDFFDAIGRALEVGIGHVAAFGDGRFAGAPLVAHHDEKLFAVEVTMVANAHPATVTIAADAKHLRTLRQAVGEAMETGMAPPREWGKGRRVAVERVGAVPVVAQPSTDATPTRYDGGQGGGQAWRWEVGE